MLARVFIDHAEVGMAILHGLPSNQPSKHYTFAGSLQVQPEIVEERTEITCDLYCKTYLVNDAFVTSNKHIGKFHFRDYLTGHLYHGYTYVSGSLEFSAQGLRGRICRFVSGENLIPEEHVHPQTFPYPVGFPSEEIAADVVVPSCKNLVEIQQQGETIAAMSPSGEITIFKEDFQKAAEYLAQCFGPPLFSGPILKMPQEEAPQKEDKVQGMIPFEPGIFEEKIDGYKEYWNF